MGDRTPEAAGQDHAHARAGRSHGEGDLVELEFEGDGFLYRMVRLIVGSLVQVGRGRASEAWFADLLATHEGLQSNQMEVLKR